MKQSIKKICEFQMTNSNIKYSHLKTKLLLTFLFLFSLNNLVAQVEDAWVYFKDKPSQSSFIASPLNMLSQRALDRRMRYSVALDFKDVPAESSYILQVKNTTGITVKAKSKWLNALHIQGTQTDINKILNLNFVSKIEFANKSLNASGKNRKQEKTVQKLNKLNATNLNYGNTANQIQMLKGNVLHENNFTGQGMQIAIIDAGFPNVNNFAAFKRIRDNNQILGGYDYVNRNQNFYTGSSHGMSVLSTIAGYMDNQFVGTAPDAKFYLFISEDDLNETPLEESLWVEAAEKADSLGVDVINSSLGYYEFDDRRMNHTYADMNGKKTRVTQGANMAFQKGILVFCSAGNEANNSWKRIIAPSDGENVIGVAAVDINGTRAFFSSVGPASGGAIKPNVAAMGAGTTLVNSNGSIGQASGTSFSSPVLAGMGACLLQANPYAGAKLAKMAIELSANQYDKPDSLLGFGIPDFEKADKYLKVNSASYLNWKSAWAISPNPFSDFLFIRNLDTISDKNNLISIYNLQGICLFQSTFISEETIILKNLANLPQGFLIMRIRSGEKEERIKLIKTR